MRSSGRSFSDPLAKAKGLGSAKHGASHWWAQRLTAIALIPLTVWILYGVLGLIAGSQADAIAWLSRPLNAVITASLVIAVFYHMQLGLQVVVEDYVHKRSLEVLLQVLIKFAAIGGGLACLLAIVRIALRSATPYG